ncbi:hypothetical protein HDU96_003139 [Phlyctochytrium bullatum]|nr:hypothetical protein HDU96_003139 [Phlyctochytrium bullatum]
MKAFAFLALLAVSAAVVSATPVDVATPAAAATNDIDAAGIKKVPIVPIVVKKGGGKKGGFGGKKDDDDGGKKFDGGFDGFDDDGKKDGGFDGGFDGGDGGFGKDSVHIKKHE